MRVIDHAQPPAATTPTDRPSPNTESDPHDQPQRQGEREHPMASQVTQAQLVDRLHRAKSREAAELLQDEARALPSDQQAEFARMVDEKFPGEG